MLKIDSRTIASKFQLLYLIGLFFLSFANGFITEFAFLFVFGGVFVAFLNFKKISILKHLLIFTVVVLLMSLLQYAALDVFAWKAILNFCGFIVGIASVAAIISQMSQETLVQLDIYLRTFIFILGSLYALTPLLEFGFANIFFIEGNYLYASANRFLANGLIEKQMMSAFLLLYIIVSFDLIKKRAIAMTAIIPLVFAINMLLASRSQIIGFIIALFLIVATRRGRYLRSSSIITSLIFFLALYIMSLEFFADFHQIDIRVMLFHAAAITFFSNLFFGVGLYNLPQFLDANNQEYLYKFGGLFSEDWGSLASFPTGFESSFLQFAVELGVIWFFLLYLAVKFLITNYYNTDARFKYIALFGLAYFFSAITEDNLSQPPIYILVAIFLGLYLKGARGL